MGRVLSFEQLAQKRSMPKGHLDYDKLDKYLEMLEVHREVLEELFIVTEDELKANGFNPRDFELDEESAHRYVSADLVEFMDGGEESLEISYDGVIDNSVYKTVAHAEIQNNAVVMYVDIMKLDGREWLIKVGNDWEKGPGEMN